MKAGAIAAALYVVNYGIAKSTRNQKLNFNHRKHMNG
jgi:hypothetical protein